MRIAVAVLVMAGLTSTAVAAELGGVRLGAPVASVALEQEGCVRVAYFDPQHGMRQDYLRFPLQQAEAKLGLTRARRDFVLKEARYRCPDRRYFTVTWERKAPHRVFSVTLLFCSGDEQKGEALIDQKLGRPNGGPRLFAGNGDLGLPVQADAPSVPPEISVLAYKNAEGCNVRDVGSAALFGLLFLETDLHKAAAAQRSQEERRAIEAVLPPSNL
ncbi:hypothetical protein [Hyphomicrobium sp.]|uniref:hypothetical protein n=1 Tax=Hyphomicrobium sp. TaxID=82 RepID=UPI003F6EA0F8